MSKNYQKLLALGMSGTLIFATSAPIYAEGDTDTNTTEQPAATAESAAPAAYEKYESVYARLTADGKASDAYVVNHFSVDKAVPIVDYGNYTSVKNLTNLDDLTDENGKVTLDPEQGEFYYQGTLENPQLPWLFSITYKLDGQAISAEELAGKSGKLEIHFTATKNPNADPSFYDNYVNQISLTLDSDKAKNIKAAGATAADAGANRQLTFTMLPGTDGDYTITADVTDFSMSGFSIAAVPYSMDIDTDQFNMDDFTDQLDELTDAVDQLSSGTADLASGAADLAGGTGDLASGSADLASGTVDLAKGVGDMQSGGSSLLDGSTKIQNGLNEIGSKSGTIVDASAKIRDALNTVSKELGSADFSGLTSLKELPGGLLQLAGALDQVEGGLIQLYDGYSKSYQALDQYMGKAKASTSVISESDLQLLAMAAGTYDALKSQGTGTGSGHLPGIGGDSQYPGIGGNQYPGASGTTGGSQTPSGGGNNGNVETPSDGGNNGNVETPSDGGNNGNVETPSDGGNTGSTETPAAGDNAGSTETPADGGNTGSTETPAADDNTDSADTPAADDNTDSAETPAVSDNTDTADSTATSEVTSDTTDAAADEQRTSHSQPDQAAQPVGDAMKAYYKLLGSYSDTMALLTVYYGDAARNMQGVNVAFQSLLAVLNPDETSPTADTSLTLAIETVSDNLKNIANSMNELTETDIEGQMNELKKGLNQLAGSYGEFHDGLVAYTDGINTLSGSYGDFQDGLTTYVKGVGDLHDGVNKLSDGAYQLADGVNQLSDGAYQLADGAGDLSDGMYEFADGISDMPNQIQDTIDDMMEQYSSSDYDAISFADSRNVNMASVQFVISTDGVEEPAAETVEETETQQGFLDRLKALFIKK
ncbi:hypothetical protein [Gemmiger sp.]